MKRTIIYTLFLLSFVCQQANATHIVQNQYDSSLNQSEHMSWWTHDRFGLFIHWGLYAMPARHEWVKSREKCPMNITTVTKTYLIPICIIRKNGRIWQKQPELNIWFSRLSIMMVLYVGQ